ncbi:MAG: NAD-dependent epimerase/dehydratase family protein [Chloroflexi bacterium]|nr:NAD-dependent epimerase/dehydratase family protein [Chloroflexota bacterium]MCL5075396.1 NAD-dependent epimerase/dehydratase family protein [Chloroflexota bacterium]
MAVLVTGVGYMGAKLVEDLLADGQEVVAVENFFSADSKAVQRLQQRPGFHLIRGSVANRRTLERAFTFGPKIGAVFALAAQSSAHPSAASVRYTENTNLLAPRLLLEAMLHYGIKSLVFASSLKVYGDHLTDTVREDTPYGCFQDLAHLSKCYVEKLIEMYASRYALDCFSLRFGIVYGLGPLMKHDYRFMTVPNKFCLQAVWGEELVVQNGRVHGFIHVADASRAMQLVLTNGQFRGYTPLNVVSETTTIGAVARIVSGLGAQRGLVVSIRYMDQTMDDPRTVQVLSSLPAIGFRPERNLEDGLGEVIDHFLQREGKVDQG